MLHGDDMLRVAEPETLGAAARRAPSSARATPGRHPTRKAARAPSLPSCTARDPRRLPSYTPVVRYRRAEEKVVRLDFRVHRTRWERPCPRTGCALARARSLRADASARHGRASGHGLGRVGGAAGLDEPGFVGVDGRLGAVAQAQFLGGCVRRGRQSRVPAPRQAHGLRLPSWSRRGRCREPALDPRARGREEDDDCKR